MWRTCALEEASLMTCLVPLRQCFPGCPQGAVGTARVGCTRIAAVEALAQLLHAQQGGEPCMHGQCQGTRSELGVHLLMSGHEF